MSVLSGQSIRRREIFTPFCERSRHDQSGLTYGVGPAGYDVRIKDDVTLKPGGFKLAVTMEHFNIPKDCVAIVHDKSTLARLGLTVQNTVAEPGWRGYLTLELTNHGRDTLQLYDGQPIAQVVIHKLDEETEMPYVGRYQDQLNHPVEARMLGGLEENI